MSVQQIQFATEAYLLIVAFICSRALSAQALYLLKAEHLVLNLMSKVICKRAPKSTIEPLFVGRGGPPLLETRKRTIKVNNVFDLKKFEMMYHKNT